MPAMNAAIAALDTLKQNDISLVKTMTNPPNGVKLVMEAVCIMKALKPDKKVDGTGKAVEDFWPTAKKVQSLVNVSVLTLFRPMEFSIHTIKSGWFIVYIEGSQVIIFF